ncbi:MAG TPA: OmpA family protein [bacterium]|jgi:outer membrane protein OmpA-like peptidoglycan-associated protein
MSIRIALAILICALFLSPVHAQYRDTGVQVGIMGSTTYDNSDGVKNVQPGLQARLSLAATLLPFAQLELGGGFTELRSEHSHTVMTPADLIMKLSPGGLSMLFPYFFGGAGVLNYRYDDFPLNTAAGTVRNGWVPYIPVGAGLQFKLSQVTQLDLRGTYNQMLSSDVSPSVTRTQHDRFWGVLAGVQFTASRPNRDWDKDGLSNKDEKRLGTNPKKADTDGDGLTDGDEVHTYHSDPLKMDTDGDGLADGDEVLKHHTDPLKTDTDGDGLSDFAEVTQYQTDPLKTDTDGDGLSDSAEVMQYKTDPNKADTDGDGLADGLEVNKYKTDPLKMDTDGGTVPDGLEVERGTDPLASADDVPAPQVMMFELDKPVVLPGIQFEFNKAVIKPESEAVLIEAYNSLHDHKDIDVEIGGYADAIGSAKANQMLSQKRAESVRQWMINKGIEANRLMAVGYGKTNPIATNDTEEGRALNRRIEFKRTK